MRQSSLPLAVLILMTIAAPSLSFAQSGQTPPAERDDGLLPNEEELRELGDLAERMLRRFGDRMEPMAERLRALVDDLDAYEAPEMLPNGDIIIRRKPDVPERAPEEDTDGEDGRGGVAL